MSEVSSKHFFMINLASELFHYSYATKSLKIRAKTNSRVTRLSDRLYLIAALVFDVPSKFNFISAVSHQRSPKYPTTTNE